jgi:hypothetical protein
LDARPGRRIPKYNGVNQDFKRFVPGLTPAYIAKLCPAANNTGGVLSQSSLDIILTMNSEDLNSIGCFNAE